jgi:hypothetical protein
MKINCLGCGHNLECSDAYNDYEGRVRCFGCGTILQIKTQEGQVRSVDIADKTRQTDKQFIQGQASAAPVEPHSEPVESPAAPAEAETLLTA